MPLEFLLPLLPRAANGQAVVPLPASNCGDLGRWRMPSIGHLQCQIECAMDRQCHYFQVDSAGDCTTFTTCTPMKSRSAAVFKYALRASGDLELTENHDRPFILGTILHGNKVLINDSYNPQWNNLEYSQDLGLSVYPPYPEASGYAMSADIAAFLASVGMASLAQLQWKAWAIEDTALGTILAGLSFDLLQMPTEVREHVRVIGKSHRWQRLMSWRRGMAGGMMTKCHTRSRSEMEWDGVGWIWGLESYLYSKDLKSTGCLWGWLVVYSYLSLGCWEHGSCLHNGAWNTILDSWIPVGPHKAVAEVSKIEHL